MNIQNCGNIVIEGGNITATGGSNAAGIGSGITYVIATRSDKFLNVPIGKVYNDQGSGAVTFGSVEMHDGSGDGYYSDSWTNWPDNGGTYGSILVTASDYGTNNGRTWTLTPKQH